MVSTHAFLGPLLLVCASACRSTEAAQILWPSDFQARQVVQVRHLKDAELEALGSLLEARAGLEQHFAVHVVAAGPTPPMAGSYRLEGGALSFQPSFDWTPNLDYVARYRSPLAGSLGTLESECRFVQAEPEASTQVLRVSPSAALLPENLLRMYLYFSAPMRRGQAYEHVRLLDAEGVPVHEAFIPFQQELWNHAGTRLTLLLDPGRIKRGLVPNLEFGAPLQADQRYTLVVDSGWLDERGVRLREAFSHSFRTTSPDRESPDVALWELELPPPGGMQALNVRFPEALDQAQLQRMIEVLDGAGEPLEGRVTIGEMEALWSFVPVVPWRVGAYELRVDALLEDLAGNSFARAFEQEWSAHSGPQETLEHVTRGFLISDP